MIKTQTWDICFEFLVLWMFALRMGCVMNGRCVGAMSTIPSLPPSLTASICNLKGLFLVGLLSLSMGKINIVRQMD